MFVTRRFFIRTISTGVLKKIHRRTFASSTENILDSELPDIQIPNNLTVHDIVFQNINKWSDKTAVECGITGRKYTYEDVRIKSRNLSRALRKKLKLSKGDVIAVLSPNVPEYPIVLLGGLSAGLTLTTINPLYTAEEISRQLSDSSAKLVITLTELYKTAKDGIRMTQKDIPVITINNEKSDTVPHGAINFAEFVENEVDIDDIVSLSPSDSIAFMPYSSGTTGLPKGVELTHYNIVANISQNSHPQITLCDETTENYQDVVPVILPMFHIYGLTVCTLYSLSKGCKLVTLPKFAPDTFTNMLINHKPTVLLLAPPLVLFLTVHPDIKPEHLASIKNVLSGAAPLGASDEERFLEKANKPINMLQGYGMTETSPGISMVHQVCRKKYPCHGSIGKPLPNTLVKIVPSDNPHGPALEQNKTGELLVKGPQVMRGYHNRPDQNNEVFVDGWLRTGDVAYYNEHKLLFVTDRLKELIKVKGFQVPPAELEEIIRSYPDVSDAGVIGVPHMAYGEIPRAYIVPKSGKTVDLQKLDEFVSSKVAKYKQLKGGIAIVDSIPKNSAGKILRRQLKLQYEAENK